MAVAARTGMIAALGRHVLRTAWRREVPGAEELSVSVNVSAHQIAAGELPGDVRDALRSAGLPPRALALR